MFEQHPVPQQISSYQFRLVGDMTLKQFFQLAAGAVIGLLIYASPLPSIFKWPLIIFFVICGAAFAFLPLQERPLEQWLSAFFRAVYGPTRFVWTKPTKGIIYFAPEEGAAATETPQAGTTPLEAHTTKLEETEKTFLNRLTNLFTLSPKSPTPAAVIAPQAPQPLNVTVAPPTAFVQPTIQQPVIVEEKKELTTPLPTAVGVNDKQGVGPVTPKPQEVTPLGAVSQTLTPTMTPGAVSAQFSADAAPPLAPTTPNIIVGQVMDSNGKIVPGAIMEIKDQDGRPVRALRTNQAGHFMIVTQLPIGSYKMVIERDGLIFDPVNLETKGTILPPVAIRARNALT